MLTYTSFQVRAYAGEADRQPICDLLNLCATVDALDTPYKTPAQLAQALAHPDLDPRRDVRLWEDAAGRLLGYGVTGIARACADNVTDALLTMSVHPAVRNIGLDEAILAWAGARVRAVGLARGQPARLRVGLRETTPAYIAYRRGVLVAHGFQPARTFFRLALRLDQPLPPPHLPAGYILRPTAGPAEAAQWVDVYNDSFVDHWNHQPATVAGILHGMADPHYDRERDLVAVGPDGRFVAFCRCGVNPEDNAQKGRRAGEIDVLGPRRGYRRLGLGRALLLVGLHRLRAAGLDTALRWVDADNRSGALRLYESVGFVKILTNVSYQKNLSASLD